MFSLQEVPRPAAAGAAARRLRGRGRGHAGPGARRARPEPAPRTATRTGPLAEPVAARFAAIERAEVAEQRFRRGRRRRSRAAQPDRGPARALRAPGRCDRPPRRRRPATGAASSIASTAALLEIASASPGSTHEKTLVFVSTDGGSLGAAGARRFAEDYSDAALLDAVVVISQPAAPGRPSRSSSPGPRAARAPASSSPRPPTRTVTEETDRAAGDEGPLDELFRLAIPAALGEQAPLVEKGFDAVRLSSSGELPPPAAEDTEGGITTDTLDRFGRAALSLMLALDAAREPLEHGPGTYIGLAGNLLPGLDPGAARAGAVAGAGRRRLSAGLAARAAQPRAGAAGGRLGRAAGRSRSCWGSCSSPWSALPDWSRARRSPSPRAS